MRNRMILFGAMVLVQWAVPLWMLRGVMKVMSGGEVFKFRTAPIDPMDPFRGEYITLNFEATQRFMEVEEDFERGDKVYATLVKDDEGFAGLGTLSSAPPAGGVPYVTCTVQFSKRGRTRVTLPFDHYYLEEGTGTMAERLVYGFGLALGDGLGMNSYALVRIADGEGLIEDVMVGDKSLREWLKPPTSAPTEESEGLDVPPQDVEDQAVEEAPMPVQDLEEVKVRSKRSQ